MPDERQMPPPKPERPEIEERSRVKINLMRRRYALEITAKAFELKQKPAEVIEIPKPEKD